MHTHSGLDKHIEEAMMLAPMPPWKDLITTHHDWTWDWHSDADGMLAVISRDRKEFVRLYFNTDEQVEDWIGDWEATEYGPGPHVGERVFYDDRRRGQREGIIISEGEECGRRVYDVWLGGDEVRWGYAEQIERTE